MKSIILLCLVCLSGISLAQRPNLIIPIGHTGAITSISFSSDGKYFLTTSEDGNAKVWDLEGREILTLQSESNCTSMGNFSPDGKYIITTCDVISFQIWDRKTGDLLFTEAMGDNLIFAANFSPDSELAEVTYEGGTRQYRIKEGRLEYVRTKPYTDGYPDRTVTTYARDGRFILTPEKNKAILRDQNGQQLLELNGHLSDIKATDISRDNKYLLTADSDSIVKYWSIAGQMLANIKMEEGFGSIAFSPDAKFLITESKYFAYYVSPKVYNLSGEELTYFSGYRSVAFSPDSKLVITGSGQGAISMWTPDGKLIRTLNKITGSVKTLGFGPDGHTLLTASENPVGNKAWRLSDMTVRSVSPFSPAVFSPDGLSVLTFGKEHTAVLRNADGQQIQVLRGHKDRVTSLAFSPICPEDPKGGRMLLTASSDSTAILWNRDGKLLHSFPWMDGGLKTPLYGGLEDNAVFSAIFSPDGKSILLQNEKDAQINEWKIPGLEKPTAQPFLPVFHPSIASINSLTTDARSQNYFGISTANGAYLSGDAESLIPLEIPQKSMATIAIAPNKPEILSGNYGGQLTLWDADGTDTFQKYVERSNWVKWVDFLPDGSRLITVDQQQHQVQLWDAQGRLLELLQGHKSLIHSCSFSPDGQYILTASADRTVRIWDLSGNVVKVFSGHKDEVTAAVFFGDGFHILSGDEGGQAIIWNLQGKVIKKLSPWQDEDNRSSKRIEAVAVSPNGSELLITRAEYHPQARILDLQGKVLFSIPYLNSEPGVLRFSDWDDGQHIIVLLKQAAHLFDKEGTLIQQIQVHDEHFKPLAFSPDGKKVLQRKLEGWIKIRDTEGRILQEFVAHEQPVSTIDVSPDGQFFLTASQKDRYAKLWDRQGREVRRFAHPDHCTAAVFSPTTLKGTVSLAGEGRYILTAGSDHTARLWDWSGREIRRFTGHKDVVTSVAFSPDGRYLLTGSEDHTVKYWDLAGNLIKTFFKGTIGSNWHVIENVTEYRFSQDKILDVRFAPNGQQVLIDYDEKFGSVNTVSWNIADWEKSELDEKVLLSTQDQRYQLIWDQDSLLLIDTAGIQPVFGTQHTIQNQKSKPLPATLEEKISDHYYGDLPEIVERFDRYVIAMEPRYEEALLFDLNGQVLHSFGEKSLITKTPDDRYFLVETPKGRLLLWDLVKKQVRPVEMPAKELLTALSFFPDGQYYIYASIGTGNSNNLKQPWGNEFSISTVDTSAISLWDIGAQRRFSLNGHHNIIRDVVFSPNGKWVVSGGSDHTIKIWDRNTGAALLTLIPVDSTDWVVTSPEGLFDASSGAMNRLYYLIGQEVVELDQLKARYFEPGLLQKTLGYSDERIRPVETFDDIKLYPKVTASIQQKTLHVQLQERSGGIGKVSLFINGKEVVEELNPLPRRENTQRDSLIQYDLEQHQNYLFQHPDSINIISIRAYNAEGWLKSPSIDLEYRAPGARSRGRVGRSENSSGIGQLAPKLYVLSIGTSNYTGTKMDLQYADQDASMMARALQAVGTALFTNGDSLEVHCLSTARADSTGLEDTPIQWQFANKEHIKSTFETIKRKAKAEDVIVVYLSGHGVTQGGMDQTQFYYLTQGVSSEDDLVDPATLRAYTISSEELTKWINAIPALKQVLIIDACNSGQIVENLTSGTKTLNSSQIRALDRMKDRTGMFVLSGSAADKVSYEAGEYGQGLLTYALLQGMLGIATRKDSRGKETIDVMKLFQYARDRVPELATSINGVQTPMLGFPQKGASFDIGILDEAAKSSIPIGNKKPVFIKNNFINLDALRDDLRLTQQLEAALRAETEKGAAADLIYVDVSEYPNAYSLGGYYQIMPDQTIEAKIRLFQGSRSFPLLINPTDDPERWIKLLIKAVKKKVNQLEKKQ